MQASRMRIGDIGIGAFDPARKVGCNEKVEDTIHAIGRYPLATLLRNLIGNVIGGRRLFVCCQHCKDIGAHVSPLLASVNQCRLCCVGQRGAAMFVVMM